MRFLRPIAVAAATLAFAAPAGAAEWSASVRLSVPEVDAFGPFMGQGTAGALHLGFAGRADVEPARRLSRTTLLPDGSRTTLRRIPVPRAFEAGGFDARGNALLLAVGRVRGARGRSAFAVEATRVPVQIGVRGTRWIGPKGLPRELRLAVNRDGEAVAAWIDGRGGADRLRIAEGDTAHGLRLVTRVRAGDRRAARPAVAISERGEALVAYQSGGRLRLLARPRRGAFAAPVDLGRAGRRTEGRIDVSADAEGGAVVAWAEPVADAPQPGAFGVWATVRQGTRWSRAARLEGAMPARSGGPDALMGAGSAAIVAYPLLRTAVSASAVLSWSHAGAEFGPPLDLSGSGAPPSRMVVTEAGDGTLFAAWSNSSGITIATRSAGGRWGDLAMVDPGPDRAINELALAAGSISRAAVAYTARPRDGSAPRDVYVARYRPTT